MKNGLIRNVVLGALVACAMSAGTARAADFTLNGSDPYQGFMNVFDLGGGYQFNSSWGTADLCAVFTGNELRFSPNTIGDTNSYWYTPSGQPGAAGNKIMEANMYVEYTGPLAGQTVNFTGMILSNTLTSAHVAKAFIRDFAPDFSSVVEQSVVLPVTGTFSLTLNTINDPARHVQYGFQMKGVNVWVTDVAPYGAVVLGPIEPTPTQSTTWGRVKAMYR